MLKHVYLASGYDYDSYEVYGVFSMRKLAETALNESEDDFHYWQVIHKQELNNPASMRRVYKRLNPKYPLKQKQSFQ